MKIKYQKAFLMQFTFSSSLDILIFPGSLFFTAFALYNRFSETQIGILASMAGLANLLQLISTVLYKKYKSRKRVILILKGLKYCSFILLMLIPVFTNGKVKLVLILCIYFLSFAFEALIGGGLIDWNNYYVAQESKGRYYSNRNLIANVIFMLFTFTIAPFLDHYGKQYQSFLIISGVVLLLLLIELFVLTNIPDQTMDINMEERTSIKKLLTEGYKNKEYLQFIIFNSIWALSINLSRPYQNIYLVEHLNITYTLIGGIASITAFVKILTARLWGRAGDKKGWNTMLFWTGVGFGLTNMAWVLIPFSPYVTYAIIFLLNGLCMIGVNIAIFNKNVELTENRDRITLWGVNAAIVGVFSFIGPNISAFVLKNLAVNFLVLGYEINTYIILFFVSGVIQVLNVRYFVHSLKSKKQIITESELLSNKS